jgi:hypothetical protein
MCREVLEAPAADAAAGPPARVYVPATADAAPLAGAPVLAPYPPLEPLQQKRLAARRHNVTYCYDFPAVFDNALRSLWTARAAAGGWALCLWEGLHGCWGCRSGGVVGGGVVPAWRRS